MAWLLQAYIAGQEYKGPQQSAASAMHRAACQASQSQSPAKLSLETPFGREAHKSFSCMVSLSACCCRCYRVSGLEEGEKHKSSCVEVS